MKGIRFFAEMPEARNSKSASKAYPFQPWTRETLRRYAAEGRHVNVCAVIDGTARLGDYRDEKKLLRDVIYDTISSVFERSNSPVAGSSCSQSYLNKRAVRIDEALARKLHPALFQCLDMPD